MKYQNKANNKIAELIEINDKTKMVILQTENGPTSTTISTFKRWWKKMEDENNKEVETEEVAASKNTEQKLVPMPGIEKLEELKEEYCADGRKYSDIGKEIAEQAKEKAKQASKKKETRTFSLTDIESILPNGITYESCRNGKDIKLKKKDELIAVLYIGNKSITIYFNSKAIKSLVEYKESKEKFSFYGKITSDDNLKDVLYTLEKEN